MKFVWTQYGHRYHEEDFNTILSIEYIEISISTNVFIS